MTATLLDPTVFGAPLVRSASPPVEEAERVGHGGRATLEELISGAWEGLAAGGTVSCLVCGGALRPRPVASAAGSAGGRCADCGSALE